MNVEEKWQLVRTALVSVVDTAARQARLERERAEAEAKAQAEREAELGNIQVDDKP